MSNRKVYVGNLDWRISEGELTEHMAEAGSVVFARIFMDYDGRSKGSGIVEYATDDGAEEAIRRLHDTELGTRKIFVREDQDKGKGKGKSKGKKGRDDDDGYSKGYGSKGERKGKGKGKGGGSKFGEEERGRVVFFGNLPWSAAVEDIQDLVRPYGEVSSCEIAYQSDGRSRGFATVLFEQEQAANEAIQGLNETDLQGRSIIVRHDNHI